MTLCHGFRACARQHLFCHQSVTPCQLDHLIQLIANSTACRYFGVLWALQSIGVITPGVTPIGAVSGGSVAAASNCLGLDFERQVMPAAQAAASICRANNMCAGTLNSVMEPSLRSLLEPAANDATALARCNRTYVYVSEGQPGIELAPRGVHFVGSTPTLVDSSSAEVSPTQG